MNALEGSQLQFFMGVITLPGPWATFETLLCTLHRLGYDGNPCVNFEATLKQNLTQLMLNEQQVNCNRGKRSQLRDKIRQFGTLMQQNAYHGLISDYYAQKGPQSKDNLFTLGPAEANFFYNIYWTFDDT